MTPQLPIEPPGPHTNPASSGALSPDELDAWLTALQNASPTSEAERSAEVQSAAALLAAVERAINALEVRLRAVREGRVAPPRPRAPAPPPPPPEVGGQSESRDVGRHDTVVMDVDAIRAFAEQAGLPGAAQLDDRALRVEAEPQLPAQAQAPPPPPAPVAAPLPPARPQEPTGDFFVPTWSRDVELLYDDALYLFQNDDPEGALISLERLLVLAPRNEDIQQFVQLNELKLVSIYERIIGPWTRPLIRTTGRTMPPAYTRDPKLAKVLDLAREGTNIGELFETLPFSRLEVCCLVNQLLRSRLLTRDIH